MHSSISGSSRFVILGIKEGLTSKTIHFRKDLLNIPGPHTFGVKGYDLVFDLIQHSLALPDYLRLKFSLPIPGNPDLQSPGRGLNSLRTVDVSGIVGISERLYLS